MSEEFISIRTVLEGVAVPRLRAGVPSFLGVPLAHGVADYAAADVVILGIPQGAAASPGRDPAEWADYGRAPADVRRQSLRYGGYLPEHDLDVFEHLRVVDAGDVEIVADDPAASVANAAARVREVIEAGCRLITIGGCVPTANYGVGRGLAEATDGAVGTISLDAHGDVLDDLGGEPGNTRPGPGTWLRRLWEHCPNIERARHVEIGMRGPRNVRAMVETYREGGALLYPAATVRRRGIEAVCEEAFPHAFAGTERVWLSLCMDVLDIGAIPDWGDEPLGLSAVDVAHVAHEVARTGADAVAIQFVAPDSPGAARLCCYLCVYIMAGWVLAAAAE